MSQEEFAEKMAEAQTAPILKPLTFDGFRFVEDETVAPGCIELRDPITRKTVCSIINVTARKESADE